MNHRFECQFGDILVVISPAALETMLSFRQKKFFSREAGGQLFAAISSGTWTIEAATGPRATDKRGRYHFRPDRREEQKEIDSFYQKGLEFVGDWHTHPQDRPHPSNSDLWSIANLISNTTHRIPGLLMCIIGRNDPPDGIWLSFHAYENRNNYLPFNGKRN